MARYELVGSHSTATANRLAGMGGALRAYAIDLGSSPGELLSLKEKGKPIVMLNASAAVMAEALGIGVDSAGAVWHPGRNGRPGQILFAPHPSGKITPIGNETRKHKREDQGGHEPSGEAAIGGDPFAPMHGIDLVQVLDEAARNPLLLDGSGTKVDPIPDGAAGAQFILSPATPTAYHPVSYTWHHRDKPQTIRDQTATLSLPVFVELYASPSPANKFLRVTAFGTGFSPGKLKWYDFGERGMFQDRLWTKMEIGGPPAGSSLIISEPKTQNNKATYTSSASITIGIKGGKESPEPSGSATISASVSSTLSDFLALEKSAGLVGEWAFDMQLCGEKSDGKYDVNSPLSLIGLSGVWPVPGLARSTLFPACMSAWALPLSCQKRLPLTITLCQRLPYVACGVFEGFAAGCEITIPYDFQVDFGTVNV